MTYTGICNLEFPDHPQSDAGLGRMVWLRDRIQPTDRLVDLGGVGALTAAFHDPALTTALDDLSGFGPGQRIHAGTFHKGDVQALPFQDNEFDVAVLTEVLEHVPLPWVAMREAGRVAKKVLITTPCEGRWQVPIAFRVAGHIRQYTLDMFALHLRMAGLDGSIGLLEWGNQWSFWVGEVSRV